MRIAAVVGLGLLLSARPAAAQIFKICGDVDDNDSVTVSDGVQVLRAAAGLESDCTDAICDVDVNGTIGVSDGVNVLRKAAGLSIRENCIPDEGNINQQVAYLIQHTQPLLSAALGNIILRKGETSDNSFTCDNGEDGLVETTFADGQLDIGFSTCLVDNFQIDGTADNANDDPELSLDIIDNRTEEDVTFDGRLLGINTETGVKYSGILEAVPTFERFDTSDFRLSLSSIEVNANGVVLAGSITFIITEDTAIPDIEQVKIFYDGSNLARVFVTFSDNSFKNYKYELIFGNFL